MIKKVLIVIIVLFGFNTINAQTLKYHKVLMQGDENLAKRLLELGITIDHSDVQGNDIAAEISDYELQTLKSNGVKHKILI